MKLTHLHSKKKKQTFDALETFVYMMKSKSQKTKSHCSHLSKVRKHRGTTLKTDADAGAVPQIPFCDLNKAMVGPSALRLRAL